MKNNVLLLLSLLFSGLTFPQDYVIKMTSRSLWMTTTYTVYAKATGNHIKIQENSSMFFTTRVSNGDSIRIVSTRGSFFTSCCETSQKEYDSLTGPPKQEIRDIVVQKTDK